MNKSLGLRNRPSLGGILLQHAIVFLICVVFPGLVTLVAPATWLTFQCRQEQVSCTARTCMFFVVPFKNQRVEHVVEITSHERAGGTKRERKYGRDTNKRVYVDGEGFLQIQGIEDQFAEVSVSPASLKNVVSKPQTFLNSKQEGNTTIFTIANWKFGGLMGGILTSFTLLYVVGYSIGAIKFLLDLPGKIIRGRTLSE